MILTSMNSEKTRNTVIGLADKRAGAVKGKITTLEFNISYRSKIPCIVGKSVADLLFWKFKMCASKEIRSANCVKRDSIYSVTLS